MYLLNDVMVTKTIQENEDLCHHLSQEILLQSRFQVYMSFKLGKTKPIFHVQTD